MAKETKDDLKTKKDKNKIPLVWLFAGLILIAGSSLLFYSPMYLYDLISGSKASGFYLQWPAIRFFLEPYYAWTQYVLTMNRNFYKPAIISWLVWTVIAVIVYCWLSRKVFTLKQTLIKVFYGLLFITSLFIMTAILPLEGPKLIKPAGYIAVDVHSHSLYSHDGVATTASNLRFHKAHGYDSFFITEHQISSSFKKFPDGTQYKTTFPGMEMQTSDGISLILLAQKEFDAAAFGNKTTEELIDLAHENDMLVIMPHWWKWHKFTFQELSDMGIDGFEIYNCGYRYFDEKEQRKMIDFAAREQLLMVGSTDWHGWGYMTDVWTVFRGEKGANLRDQLIENPNIKVLLYREKQSSSPVRFIFEPFSAFYYYVKNATPIHLMSFMVWFAVLFLLFAGSLSKYVTRTFPLAMSLFFAGTVLFYAVIAGAQTSGFIILTLAPALAGLCVLWLLLWIINGKNTK